MFLDNELKQFSLLKNKIADVLTHFKNREKHEFVQEPETVDEQEELGFIEGLKDIVLASELKEMILGLSSEVQGIKKSLRRQSLSLEVLKKDIIETLALSNTDITIEPFIELGDNLFYLTNSLYVNTSISDEQIEAIEIVWEKLERLFDSNSVEIIRRAGLLFDSKLHEAVENISDGTGELKVHRIVSPGYKHKNNVIKPARVVIGDSSTINNNWRM